MGELLGVSVIESDKSDSMTFNVQIKTHENSISVTKTARVEVFRAG